MDRNIDNADDIAVYQVVPYVGTWIEIGNHSTDNQMLHVVPYVGTWIEI